MKAETLEDVVVRLGEEGGRIRLGLRWDAAGGDHQGARDGQDNWMRSRYFEHAL